MRPQSCRETLRKRCMQAALWSGLVASACAASGSALIVSFLTAAVAVTRALMCGAVLTRPPSNSSHRMGRNFQLLKPQKAAALLLHCIYGLLVALSCLALVKRSLWYFDGSSGSKLLDESSLLVLFAGVVNGAYYYYMNFVMDDPLLAFPLIEQQKFIRFKMCIVPTIKKASRDSFVPIILTALLYYWYGHFIRNTALYILKAGSENEPLDGLFSVMSIPLLFHLWINSTVFLSTVYCSMLFFDIYLTENLKFPIVSEGDVTTLSQELTMDVEILNKLAARDLSYLAHNDTERRREIFSLSIPGGHPTNWKNVSSKSIEVINKYVKSVENITSDAKSIEEIKPSIHRVVLSPEPFRSLTLRNMALSPSREISNQCDVQSEPIKSLKNVVKVEFNSFIDNLCKKPGISFFFGDLTDIKIKHIAHRGQIVSKVCQGLSHLITTSLAEDEFGVVQDDMSKILICLLDLKLALDKLTKSGVINKKNLKQDSAAAQMLTELKSAVKRSIYKITISFKDYIYDIEMDSDKQMLLQPFVNLREG